MTTKVLIEVRNGMIENILTTSKKAVIYVIDYDCPTPDDKGAWSYYNAAGGDKVVDDSTFVDILNADK